MFLALLWTVPLMAQPSLQITTPASGAAVSPGQDLNVTVATSGAFQMVVLVGNGIGPGNVRTSPPFQFSIPIASDMPPGSYVVTAIGVISPGQSVMSVPVPYVVELAGQPISLATDPPSLTFVIGQRSSLRVLATYADGAIREVSRSTLINYASDSPNIATCDAYGVVTALRPGMAAINVTYAGRTVPVQVTVRPPVRVAPSITSLYASQSVQLALLSTTLTPPTVSWTVNPSGVGSVDSAGRYTAPASISDQQIVTVTATNTADATQSGSSQIYLYPPIAISVSPTAANLGASQSATFSARVNNVINPGVSWSSTPDGVGSIDYNGVYTAPSVISASQTVTIKASSVMDDTQFGSATVTLMPPQPAVVAFRVTLAYPWIPEREH